MCRTLRFVRLGRTCGATAWSRNADSCGFVAYFGFQSHDGVATLCQYRTGTRTLHWDGTEVVRDEYEDVDVDLIGVDVASGDVAWRVPLGEADAADGTPHPEPAFLSRGAKRVVPDGARRSLLVDVATGATERVAQDQLLLCTTGAHSVELTRRPPGEPGGLLSDLYALWCQRAKLPR
ncbi:hypothetical protein IM711_10530 [Microbacterium esteraromaticum]|uniref:hypothetical protein n=1 Tax=Microbacterium esteraromaticum TaxID=57043 RepID=UPI003C2B2508